MKKMNILIISQYVDIPHDNGNDRFCYIADWLQNRGHSVELLTSDFIHCKKMHQSKKNLDNLPYKVTLCHEEGYLKNVCIKRLASHSTLAHNINKYLVQIEKPDVIYCAIPSLSVAEAAQKYAQKKNIRYIVDIQDLWPEAFEMVFAVPGLSRLFFFPLRKKADRIYRSADEIVAVSHTYAERAFKVNRSAKAIPVFLGTDKAMFDKCRNMAPRAEYEEMLRDNDMIKIAYVGTLGHSYDLEIVIRAIRALPQKVRNSVSFIIMGDGPLMEKLKRGAKGSYVHFTGRLAYKDMIGILCRCQIAVNPIRHGAAQSIINKVGDYAMAGLPVVSTQECPEYQKLIADYNAGFNCRNGDVIDVKDKIYELICNKKQRVQMGKNNRRMAEELFDRSKTYEAIVDCIEKGCLK